MYAKAKILISLYVIAVVWLVYASWMTGPVKSDSWQSVAAYINANRPFELSGAFLGDFDGYDQHWGHHWPGWPLLLSLTRPYLDFHPIFIFALGAIFVCLSSYQIYVVDSRNKTFWLSVVLASFVILDPATRVSISMMRPEPLTGLLMLWVCYLVIQAPCTTFSRYGIVIGSFCLPMLHIMGLLVAPALVGTYLLVNRFSYKKSISHPRAIQFFYVLIGWLIGSTMLAIWFCGNPIRNGHLLENVIAQKLSYHNFIYSMKLCYFSSAAGFAIVIYWCIVITGAVKRIAAGTFSKQILLWLATPLSVTVFSLLSENPNSMHLVTMLPCLIVALQQTISKEILQSSTLRLSLILVGILLPAAFHAISAWRFVRTRAEPQRLAVMNLLQRNRDTRMLFIPCSLWEAAATLNIDSALFYTFPNIAQKNYRLRSEKSLLSNARPGDRLILDVTEQTSTNAYFKAESLVNLMSFNPHSLGEVIEEITIEGLPMQRTFQVIEIK